MYVFQSTLCFIFIIYNTIMYIYIFLILYLPVVMGGMLLILKQGYFLTSPFLIRLLQNYIPFEFKLSFYFTYAIIFGKSGWTDQCVDLCTHILWEDVLVLTLLTEKPPEDFLPLNCRRFSACRLKSPSAHCSRRCLRHFTWP